MPDPSPRSDPERSDPQPGRARDLLVRKWSYLFSGAAFVPMSTDELDRELGGALDALCAAVDTEPFDAAPAERVGERLVSLGHVGVDGLRRTLDVLGRGLPRLPGYQSLTDRTTAVLSALSCGFLAAHHRATLEAQENMQRSLLRAVRDAQGNLRASEARFDEVATSCASGILIVGADGTVLRANAAIGDILGHSPDELTGVALEDLVHPDSVEQLRRGTRSLIDGRESRLRQSLRLVRADGDVARVRLTASVLRGQDDRGGQLVVVVEDGTELMLLQNELHRQSLHDVLTGLPNRQYLSTRLETALRRADPVHGITLFHLDLDAFGIVPGSLGRSVGEQFLIHVGQRLAAAVAAENAMVARFDGDEFAILLENSETTPDVAAIVDRIRAALAEPTTVDGHVLSASASIGVVHRPARDADPGEPLRAAERALRRAREAGRGQWELHDPDEDVARRRADALAVGMAGAWRAGEIGVRYRPVVELAGERTTGVVASLHWSRPHGGSLGHERCVRLAERTGLALPLGEWLLRVACGQSSWWRRGRGSALPLTVGLTRYQSTDADLVARVVRVLEGTGFPAPALTVGVPASVLRSDEAADNLAVLAEAGVTTAVDDFGLGPEDLATAAALPVRWVRVPPRLGRRGPSLPAPVVAGLVAAAHEVGLSVHVDGVDTEEAATWWRRAGVDTATGDPFGHEAEAGEFLTGTT